MKHFLFILFNMLAGISQAFSQDPFSEKAGNGFYEIAGPLQIAPIYTDHEDETLINKAAILFQQDLKNVTGKTAGIRASRPGLEKNIIVIGSLKNSYLVKELIRNKKLDPKLISGKWEAYTIQTIRNPWKGVDNALVIAGSDRRGTAYGVFELSARMGVSPWYWWADVPVKKKTSLYIRENFKETDSPKIKYRGIFINDEAPALANWSKEKFGGFNHLFYEKVFELMLRLKANYLWPAMWGNAFYDDDPKNIKSADDYGIVIGTSHHEPLMRAHDEWRRHGKGKWNYDSNASNLQAFWREGMQRASNEKIVSIGMRGDGDEPMTRETATALLERIVKDQRKIIEEVTGQPAEKTPQLWALYKEVQDYYDKGMRVPDDVTLLLCDDNWGNIRRLPKPGDPPRKGGYGIYYHFDYVGGPRNYKWVNTNSIPRVWEQMHLAWQYGAREIWIVNVGDIKPMELPISFFLDYAWNPGRIGPMDLQKYTEKWAAQQFGAVKAKEIATILSTYSKFNARRKPELLNENTYDFAYSTEGSVVNNEYQKLYQDAESVKKELPGIYHDAYFQLVLHPVKACSNLYALYTAVARNKKAVAQRNPVANRFADEARQLFLNDSLITLEYHQLANGKWNHMMSQTHIGYTYWQQPPRQVMPMVGYLDINAGPPLASSTSFDVSTKHLIPDTIRYPVFFERNGIVSIEANHYSRATNGKGNYWQLLPDHGKTGDAITIFPVTATSQTPAPGSALLEYDFYTDKTDSVQLHAYFSPTLNLFNTSTGLRYGITLDDEPIQVIGINKEDNQVPVWGQWVANNIIIRRTKHFIKTPGRHVIKYWAVDPGVVLQKIVVDLGGLKPSYLGPFETRF